MAAILNNTMIKQLDCIPVGLLEASPATVHEVLPEPTLIHLPGKRPEPLFISVLLHGNEPTGFWALIELLKQYQQQSLPRAVSLFFGNTLAASQNLRRLEDQPDFNRIWPGTLLPASAETAMAQAIINIMQERQVFASIDIHNNTGLNPHYACINSLDAPFLHLARLFGRLTVFFSHPKGVQSAAFAQLCPAVTLECGRPGQRYGVEHTLAYLQSCLRLSTFPAHALPPQDLDLYHTVAQVKVLDSVDFSFTETQAALQLDPILEKYNFTDVPVGTVFGQVNIPLSFPVQAFNDNGEDIAPAYFCINNQQLQLTRATMPSMLTLDERVIRQDCLCYLMERVVL